MERVKSSKRKKGPGQGQVTEGEGELKELKRCIVKVGRVMTAQSNGEIEEHQTDLSSFRRGSNVGTSRNERCAVGKNILTDRQRLRV